MLLNKNEVIFVREFIFRFTFGVFYSRDTKMSKNPTHPPLCDMNTKDANWNDLLVNLRKKK